MERFDIFSLYSLKPSTNCRKEVGLYFSKLSSSALKTTLKFRELSLTDQSSLEDFMGSTNSVEGRAALCASLRTRG